ncbi:hypothetical protein Tco_0110518 [Tanacetum coccineum]
METLDALGSICNAIQDNCNNLPRKDSPSDPIVQSVDINTKSTSYAGAAGASTMTQPQVNSNFRPLVVDPVFNDVNISIPRKVVKKVSARLEHTLYGYFIGKRLTFPLLNTTLETNGGGSSFARCLIEVNSEADLVDSVTIGIPSLTGDDFTKETIHVEYEWRSPRCDECKIFGHVHDHYPKKMVIPPIVTTSNVVAPTVEKSNYGFQTVGKKKNRKGKSKSTNGDTSPKNDNFTTSNSFSTLNHEEDDDEEVENVYDESANLVPNTNTSGSSHFTAADG